MKGLTRLILAVFSVLVLAFSISQASAGVLRVSSTSLAVFQINASIEIPGPPPPECEPAEGEASDEEECQGDDSDAGEDDPQVPPARPTEAPTSEPTGEAAAGHPDDQHPAAQTEQPTPSAEATE